MKILELSPSYYQKWDDFVQNHPNSSIYHLHEWSSLIEGLFGHKPHFLFTENNDEISGILPLIRLKSRLFGDFMTSVPYFNYGGALGKDLHTEKLLMESAGELAESLGVSHIEFRDVKTHENFPVKLDKITMELKLPDSPEELWKQFKPKLRAQIRRPEKAGAITKTGQLDLLDDFYSVFTRNMRDLGTPVYPKSFFRAILDTFPENTQIIMVYHEKTPTAAGFLIGFKDKLEIPWASSLRDYNKISVNMALYWRVLQYAIENRYKVFDFGRSSKDSGTYKFKKQWGAQEKQLYWHYWLKNGGELPALNPNNPKYQLAISTWKKRPLPVANWLGPKIVKNLP
ncbi:MAG: FemAB family PEP-CTERM system-associated protein [Gammaproteobacteria bacterium]|nr:FemAB family PEP-CTERM system-associated protein [Gammaproteobacteria bacterium]